MDPTGYGYRSAITNRKRSNLKYFCALLFSYGFQMPFIVAIKTNGATRNSVDFNGTESK